MENRRLGVSNQNTAPASYRECHRTLRSAMGRKRRMVAMTQTPLRIVVLGGGVIGSVYAAWLRQAGHQVSMLARGQRLAEVREHGLVVEDASTGRRTTASVATIDH